MIKKLIGIVVVVAFITACGDHVNTPKPRAYPRVDYPERTYVEYDTTACPFNFRYPSYGEIKYKKENCWFDIYMPAFNARIHCSYVPLKNKGEHGELVLVVEEDNRIYVTRGDKAKEFLRHLEIATLNDLGSDIEDEST